VIGTQMARDASLNADDRIEILLDTVRDQRSAFYFATNPSGALVDGLAFANGELNTDWDAIWQVRTSSTKDALVRANILCRKSDGTYVRLTEGGSTLPRRPAKAALRSTPVTTARRAS
jgi:hypothetical protein